MSKFCGACKQFKDESEFSKNSSKKDGLQALCKSCRSAYQKQWYQDNKETQYKRVVKTKGKRLNTIKSLMIEYLGSHPCVDCGEKDITVLECDHLSNKKHNVSRMIAVGMSWEKISQELQKCEIRCANCHKRKTAKQQNWYKAI